MIKKNGFALIEILIASAISGFILIGLYQVLRQVNLSVTEINKVSSIDMREFLLQNQLERDLSGAFIIFESQSTGTTPMPPPVTPPPGVPPTRASTSAPKAINKAFYSKNNGDNLEILSFITNNPLRTFDKPASLIVRVTYKLKKDNQKTKDEKNISFKLYRQESCEYLNFDVFEKSTPKSTNYEIVKNIKKLSVEYIVTITSSTVSSTPPSSPTSPTMPTTPATTSTVPGPPKYPTFKNWTKDEIEKTKKEKPDFYKFTIEFWDDQKKTYKAMKSEQQIQTAINLDVSVTENKNISKPAGQMQQGQTGLFGQPSSNINLDVILGKNKKKACVNNNGVNNNGVVKKRKPSIFDVFLTGNK